MSAKAPHVGSNVSLPDGDWKLLGSSGAAELKKGTISDGVSFSVKDGRVYSRGGGLMVKNVTVEIEPGSAGIQEDFIPLVAGGILKGIRNKIDIGTCKPRVAGKLTDGLYVSTEIGVSCIVFNGEITMDGTYERSRPDMSKTPDDESVAE